MICQENDANRTEATTPANFIAKNSQSLSNTLYSNSKFVILLSLNLSPIKQIKIYATEDNIISHQWEHNDALFFFCWKKQKLKYNWFKATLQEELESNL